MPVRRYICFCTSTERDRITPHPQTAPSSHATHCTRHTHTHTSKQDTRQNTHTRGALKILCPRVSRVCTRLRSTSFTRSGPAADTTPFVPPTPHQFGTGIRLSAACASPSLHRKHITRLATRHLISPYSISRALFAAHGLSLFMTSASSSPAPRSSGRGSRR